MVNYWVSILSSPEGLFVANIKSTKKKTTTAKLETDYKVRIVPLKPLDTGKMQLSGSYFSISGGSNFIDGINFGKGHPFFFV